ncbi:Pre-mRNA 3'-end-processing factor FIP1 FIP1-like 1 protein [Channa argus]|uniref:Pre-mRNA 3'-end-processing factor FIP1 FIP1-like 1 protein n=1 Tax=Channa argus TaxID=215402 RepID=A0A6G1PMI5_CHAAH|nr:Pre-mRNA 3'-end-processing factor FIP1 FIP1-like 1 protein [Channa argus]
MAWQSESKSVAYDDENKSNHPICANYSTDDREREDEAQPQSSSSSEDPVHVKINAEEGPHTVGANISDYFNYGFDEKSWNAYCKKQTKLRAANKKLCAKIRLTAPRLEKLAAGCFGLFVGQKLLKSTASADVTKEGSQSSRKVEGSQYLSDQGDSTQVVFVGLNDKDTVTETINSFVHIAAFLYRREPNRHSPSTALDRKKVTQKEADPENMAMIRTGKEAEAEKPRAIFHTTATGYQLWLVLTVCLGFTTTTNRFQELNTSFADDSTKISDVLYSECSFPPLVLTQGLAECENGTRTDN